VCKEKVADIVKTCPGKYRILREVKLTVRGLTFGYADVVIIDFTNRVIHVVDYKLGRLAVKHAEDNLQLHAYGVGAMERFRSFPTLHTWLIAPRVPDFTDAVFDRSIIPRTRDRIQNIISSAADVFKKPRGGPQCAFCTNKPRCVVMNNAVEGVVRQAGHFELPEQFLPERIVTAEDRAKSLLLARVLPDWCTLVKQAHTQAVLMHGEDIPGFSLRSRAGSLRVADPAVVLEYVTRSLGITHEQLLTSGVASISLAKLAELMRTECPVEEFETKRDYVNALESTLGDAVSRGPDVVYLQKDRKLTDGELVEQLTQQQEIRSDEAP
jgi:hypothetical protein